MKNIIDNFERSFMEKILLLDKNSVRELKDTIIGNNSRTPK